MVVVGLLKYKPFKGHDDDLVVAILSSDFQTDNI